MSGRVDSRVAVVTGASSGIGHATVEQLTAAGFVVAAWDLDAQATAAAHEAGGDAVVAAAVDVTKDAVVAEAAQRVLHDWGRIDVVVNCAGVFGLNSLGSTDFTSMRRQFEVNVMGTGLVVEACLDALIEARGAIVNISSAMAVKPTATNSYYGASKAAVSQLTRSWALELGPRGVRVNAIAPGPTDTGIFKAAGMLQEQIDNLLASRAELLPLRRTGRPVDIARWVVRLADPEDWITGQVIAVDGGLQIS